MLTYMHIRIADYKVYSNTKISRLLCICHMPHDITNFYNLVCSKYVLLFEYLVELARLVSCRELWTIIICTDTGAGRY